MFENLYLREKQVVVAGEAITIKKLNAADRAVLAPVVGSILQMAHQLMKAGKAPQATDKQAPEEPQAEEAKPVWDLLAYDLDKAVEQNQKWATMVAYMIQAGVRGVDATTAANLVANGDTKALDALVLEIIKFNYLELDDGEVPSKKKSSTP